MLRRAASLAERVVALRAQEQRKRSLEALYETLSRLKRYYGQMAEETAVAEDGDGVPIAGEYERRKAEEVDQARVRARAERVAVESCAAPVKALTWVDGCRICLGCVRRCLVCGEGVDWCRLHTVSNSKGEVTCRAHAVICVGCREPYPATLTETCAFCGQTVCETCKAVCKRCGRVFCMNHMGMTVCADCAVDTHRK